MRVLPAALLGLGGIDDPASGLDLGLLCSIPTDVGVFDVLGGCRSSDGAGDFGLYFAAAA